jgi:hypothetical protein
MKKLIGAAALVLSFVGFAGTQAHATVPVYPPATTTTIVAEQVPTTVIGGSGGQIPGTGSDSTVGGLQIGGAAVLLGASLVGVALVRRRRPLAA